ncbi:uncharacterized protein LOC131257682 isoform X2 [Magnolia sinica]|nr:uncharacterized protein LOC131257682 isoform X2 [Magnolia sinica]
MALKIHHRPLPSPHLAFSFLSSSPSPNLFIKSSNFKTLILRSKPSRTIRRSPISAALPPLDLTEENIRQVLLDARSEFAQIFDTSVGMTGEAELAEVDGPFVKLTLRGRFWHQRSMVLARLGNYLKNRIP